MLGEFLSTLSPAGSFAPFTLLCVLPAALRPFCSSAASLAIRHPPGHRRPPGCSVPRSSVSSHPFGVLLVARHPRGHSAHPGYPAPSWLLGALRRHPRHSAIPVWPGSLAYRYPQWPSWSLVSWLLGDILLAGIYCRVAFLRTSPRKTPGELSIHCVLQIR